MPFAFFAPLVIQNRPQGGGSAHFVKHWFKSINPGAMMTYELWYICMHQAFSILCKIMQGFKPAHIVKTVADPCPKVLQWVLCSGY